MVDGVLPRLQPQGSMVPRLPAPGGLTELPPQPVQPAEPCPDTSLAPLLCQGEWEGRADTTGPEAGMGEVPL